MAPVHLFCARRYASKSAIAAGGSAASRPGGIRERSVLWRVLMLARRMIYSVPMAVRRVRLVGVSTAIATTQRFRNKWKRISNACAPNTKYLLRGNVPNRPKKK